MAEDTKTQEKQLADIAVVANEMKSYMERGTKESKDNGAILNDTLSKITALQTQFDAMEKKFIDRQTASPNEGKSLHDVIKEHEGLQRFMKNRNGSVTIELDAPTAEMVMERKTIVASSAGGLSPSIGFSTSGVLGIDRLPGLTKEARPQLKIRNLFTSRPTTQQKVDFMKTTTPMVIASMQQETVAKAENIFAIGTASEPVQTLATWIGASRQILDDLPEMLQFLRTDLVYYVGLAEDRQLLTGDGTGQNLHGIIPQATAFNTALLGSTYTKIDCIARAIQQVNGANEVDPTFVVTDSNNLWDVRLTKDSFGRYILGDPSGQLPTRIWDLSAVWSNNMTANKFLVGTGDPVAAEIRDRMGLTIDMSWDHADYFTRNLIAIRVEERLAFICRRPGAFVYGTLAASS